MLKVFLKVNWLIVSLNMHVYHELLCELYVLLLKTLIKKTWPLFKLCLFLKALIKKLDHYPNYVCKTRGDSTLKRSEHSPLHTIFYIISKVRYIKSGLITDGFKTKIRLFLCCVWLSQRSNRTLCELWTWGI